MGNTQATRRRPTAEASIGERGPTTSKKDRRRAKKRTAATERAAAKATAKRRRKRARKTSKGKATVESNRFTKAAPMQTEPSFTKRLAKMWGRPIGPGTSRDAVRLAGRVDVELPTGADANTFSPSSSTTGNGEAKGATGNALIDALGRIAALLGGRESANVAAVAHGHFSNEGTSPDQSLAGAAVLDLLGGDSSPVVRAAKCLHQKFVLEAMGELVVGDSAPLRGHMCADDRSQQGWRIRVETADVEGTATGSGAASVDGAADGGGGIETVVSRLDRPDLATGFGLSVAELPGGQLGICLIEEGSPAAATALADGDILVAVDGIPVLGSCYRDVVGLLVASTSVDVTVQRGRKCPAAGVPHPYSDTAVGTRQVHTLAQSPTSPATEPGNDTDMKAGGRDDAGVVRADAVPSNATPHANCIRVVHARRDCLVITPQPGMVEPSPQVYVRWELVMLFSPQMRTLERADLKVVGVDIAEGVDRALLPPSVNTLIDVIGDGLDVL